MVETTADIVEIHLPILARGELLEWITQPSLVRFRLFWLANAAYSSAMRTSLRFELCLYKFPKDRIKNFQSIKSSLSSASNTSRITEIAIHAVYHQCQSYMTLKSTASSLA